jgi:hypothetical protein
VSPIDSEGSPAVADAEGPPREQSAPFVAVREDDDEENGEARALDLRLCLRGRDGRCVAMDLDSAVLCGSSAFFAGMVPDASGVGGRRVEVDGVDNLEAFKEAVELMFEPDAVRWLARAGVSRAIAVLEVRCIPFISFPFCLFLPTPDSTVQVCDVPEEVVLVIVPVTLQD